MFDLIIIGGGPAAMAAGIYAARKKLKTLILADKFGGQSVVAPEIQNWIGEISISGADLAKKIEAHLRSYEGENLVIKDKEVVTSVVKDGESFSAITSEGSYQSKTLLLAPGANRRKLNTPGAENFEQKGVTYCASCDGPMFSGQDVAVIGGGNAGFGSAGQLLAYCKSVILLETADKFRAEPVTVEKLKQNPKFQAMTNVELIEIKGEKFVSGLVYKDKNSGETKELPVTGIFVEIGFLPNTDTFKNLVNLNQVGAIMVDHQHQTTSTPGVWAAGDCADLIYHQNNIAVGDAVKAVEDIYTYLQSQ